MSPLSCADVQAILSDALDGADLEPGREAAAAEHLDGCRDCGRAARELSSVHRLIVEVNAADALGPAKPDTRHRALPRRRPPRPTPGLPYVFPAVIAAGLLVGVAVWFFVTSRPPKKQEPLSSAPSPVAARKILGTLEAAGAPGRPLYEGDRVLGPAMLTWRDGTTMTFADGSIAQRLDEEDEGKLVLFTRGSLSAEVSPQTAGKPLRFATPDGEARVLGTVLRLRVDGDPRKGTRLDVDKGRVELRDNSGRSAIVEEGFYAVSAAGAELVARRSESPGWKNVTSDLGGAVWGRGGVTLLAAVPDRDEILAGVSNEWMWSSTDGGATWKRLGSAGGEPIRNMPHHLVFDPVNPRIFWISAIYGPGLFKTTDGGTSFRRLGTLDHIDGLAVDFSDPARRTLLVTKHLDAGGLQLSTDGGETWQPIGDRLPKETRSSSAAFILDSRTFLVDASGAFNGTEGLYRSADAGETWSRVSKTLPAGPPLLGSDGTLYWQARAGFADGILKSVDRGLTWTLLKGPVKSTPVEISGGRLVGAFERQLYVSPAGGTAWVKMGDAMPVKPLRTFTGITYEALVYSPSRRALYGWRNTEGKSAEAVFRWSLAE